MNIQLTLSREDFLHVKQHIHQQHIAAQNHFVESLMPFVRKELMNQFKAEVEKAVQAFNDEIKKQPKLLEI